ncbi:MAG: substrate-binding domain-containing protein [Lachnospiraceae bacterium]|nr:substrate-binding domain-containing protein [Lachnospiraceae bacterium]
MKKIKAPVFYLVCVLVVLLIFEIAIYMQALKEEDPILQVSLIVYGSDASRWENLKQGAALAADDMNAEVTLITMSGEDDSAEQIALIQREVANGADALLIAAADSEAIKDYLEKSPVKVPYAFVESGIGDDGKMLTSADNIAMAESLIKTIDDNEKDWIKAAVIVDHDCRDSVKERLDTVLAPDADFAENVVLWERNEQEIDKKAQFFLQRQLTEEAVDVVIALDNSSMEEIIDAAVNLNKDIKIYGIANSSKSAYYLDNRLIRSLVYQDEFSIGYIGLTNLLRSNFANRYGHAGSLDKEIYFKVLDHNNMYDEKNQRLLFPHVR